MTEHFERWLAEQLDTEISRLAAAGTPPSRYRMAPTPTRRTRFMSLFSALPASLSLKAATGIAAAALAAGGAAAVVTSSDSGSSHHSSASPSSGGSANGNAANASPKGTHGDAVTDAVHSCAAHRTADDRGIGDCVSAVASRGKAHHDADESPTSSPKGAGKDADDEDEGPPSPHPSPEAGHPTGQHGHEPESAGQPSPLPVSAGPPSPQSQHDDHGHSGH